MDIFTLLKEIQEIKQDKKLKKKSYHAVVLESLEIIIHKLIKLEEEIQELSLAVELLKSDSLFTGQEL